MEALRRLDVRYLQRRWGLAPGRTFVVGWKRHGESLGSARIRTDVDLLTLEFSMTGDAEGLIREQLVAIDWTPCNFGGRRAWLLCPAQWCGRRVVMLVLWRGAFMCRHCASATYSSQHEGLENRMIRRADRIRERLGWEPGLLNGKGGKPTGMHWRTFRQLEDEHDAIVAAVERKWAQFIR